MTPQSTLNGYIRQALTENFDRPAFTDFHGNTITYAELATDITRLHLLYSAVGIMPGDKIAICARNSSAWATSFLAITTYGAVAVPILHDFSPASVNALVNHCDATLLMTDESTWHHLTEFEWTALQGVLEVGTGQLIAPLNDTIERRLNLGITEFNDLYRDGIVPAEEVTYCERKPDEPVLINYTSGSMGNPKGVVLTERNIWSNVQYSLDGLRFLVAGDSTLCMLPLAHMFGLCIDLLQTLARGCHIYFLTRTPSPAVVMEAFHEVKPRLIVSVPLVIEKIIRKKVFPQIQKFPINLLIHIPLIKNKIFRKLHDSLIGAFGGKLEQLIIGGAGVSSDVEKFLRQVHFPFTVGYGMTECGPLVAYAPWNEQRPGTCGHAVDRMTIEIDSTDPYNVPGEIIVHGDNVMQGYYKAPEATAAVLEPDGRLHTGDVGVLGSDGLLSIRGRKKSMILSPSGQNIYPEEIEAELSRSPLVGEVLVVGSDNGGPLTALIYPDMAEVESRHLSPVGTESMLRDWVSEVNRRLPVYARVARVKVRDTEFEKTPKRSIKRYLYSADD